MGFRNLVETKGVIINYNTTKAENDRILQFQKFQNQIQLYLQLMRLNVLYLHLLVLQKCSFSLLSFAICSVIAHLKSFLGSPLFWIYGIQWLYQKYTSFHYAGKLKVNSQFKSKDFNMSTNSIFQYIINLFSWIIIRAMAKTAEKTHQQIEAIKNKRKQQKKRKKQHQKQFVQQKQAIKQHLLESKTEQDTVNVEVVDVIQENQNILTGKYYDYFKGIFEKHQEKAKKYFDPEEDDNQKPAESQRNEGEEYQLEDKTKKIQKYSRSQKKKMRWLKVAELKARTRRPDLVEAWDITATDPLFLCQLKTLKNTVPVPRHWNQKSKFLQTKRGILKPMFKLPQFIEATGISKLRDPFTERDGQKMVRDKLKQRMNPKLGKIDIQYSVLHDAFFKYQTKSELTVFGDAYYEGKQDQSKSKQYKPGLLSQSLRVALGISDYQAPPWIINMQRYGAPPSYPTLRILGSTVPFSQVASYSIINKAGLEEVARKLGQPGLYATFRTYYEQEEEQFVDKGYWGQIANLDEINDQDVGEEQWAEQNEDL